MFSPPPPAQERLDLRDVDAVLVHNNRVLRDAETVRDAEITASSHVLFAAVLPATDGAGDESAGGSLASFSRSTCTIRSESSSGSATSTDDESTASGGVDAVDESATPSEVRLSEVRMTVAPAAAVPEVDVVFVMFDTWHRARVSASMSFNTVKARLLEVGGWAATRAPRR